MWFKTHLPQPQEFVRLNELICLGEVMVPFISPLRGQRSSNTLRAIGVGQTPSRLFAESSAKVRPATSPANIPKPSRSRKPAYWRKRTLPRQLLWNTERATASAIRARLNKMHCKQSARKTPSEVKKKKYRKLTACTSEMRAAMKTHSKSSLRTKAATASVCLSPH